ncbi:MAG TPA: response regulator transcription factor [Ilumatobacteraceae bacterium]|jgi:DNA-binding response OmpR family regulator
MAHLLVVEDDAAIAGPLIRALERAGHSTRWVATGGDAEVAVFDAVPELVVLDLGLPDIDGLDVCRHLRLSHEHLPIIVLTARREELDIVEGFDAGADDYMTKPFRLSELLARIRARLRAVTATRIASEDISVDVAARRAWQGDRELGLSTKEFDLLAELIRGAGTVVKRELLMDKIWGTDFVGSTKTLDVHMAWLRRKLGDDATAPRYISTVRGIGYRFEGAVSSR